MEADVLAFVAAALAGAAAVVRAVKEDLTGALSAAGLSLVALAAALGNL